MDTTTWKCGSPPQTGQKQRFPGRFEYNLKKTYLLNTQKILSIFSGSSKLGDTVDIRKESSPTIIASSDYLPIKDNTYDIIIADPPYNIGYAKEWKHNYPKPKHILKEATRVVKPGGLILILHILVIPAYKIFNIKRIALHPVLCGPNNVIRVLNVFKKEL